MLTLKFHGTDTDTDTDTYTDFLADFCARILVRKSACPASAEVGAEGRLPRRARQSACPFSSPRAGHAWRSSPTCPRTFVRHAPRALFLARMFIGDARVYTCTCTVHDKLSCTRLQNYTIGASLMSVSVSLSVPWNLSLSMQLVRVSKFMQ